MSELVVDLSDPESIALARRVLEMVSNDWPNPIASGASANRPVGEVGGSVSASAERSSQIDSKGLDDDPWAASARRPETPRDALSEPSVATSGGHASADDNDDDPWS